MKRCSKCGEEKPHEQFHRDKGKRDGLASRCKDCAIAISRQHYAEHLEENRPRRAAYNQRTKDKMHIRCKRWRDSHPLQERVKWHRWRARKKGVEGSYTAEEWVALCAFYDNRCVCCGLEKPLTVDHVQPIAKGGANTIDNIQPLCGECNNRKHQHTIDYRPHAYTIEQERTV